jgi:hypothetical protein
MDNGPPWFKPKRFGFGAGLPIAWQGWAITALYIAVVSVLVLLFRNRWNMFVATAIPATLLFALICAKTTRGGWRWRWGSDD